MSAKGIGGIRGLCVRYREAWLEATSWRLWWSDIAEAMIRVGSRAREPLS